MNFFESVASTVTAIVAIAAGGVTLYKLFVKKWLEKRQATKKAEWHKMIADLQLIKGQVFPNGGSSIHDKQEDLKRMIEGIEFILIDLQSGQRNTWEIMDVAIWKSNERGRTVYANKPYCELAGCAYTDALGTSWFGQVADFDRKRVRESHAEAIENISDMDIDFCFERADGYYQKVNAVLIHNVDKKTGNLQSSTGKLQKIAEPTKDLFIASGKKGN